MTPEEIRTAIWPVLVNASSFPKKVQPYILGQDMSPLIEKVVAAIVKSNTGGGQAGCPFCSNGYCKEHGV